MKKAPEPRKEADGGARLPGAFGRLARHFVDELKEATAEISPKHLLEAARDSIQNLVRRGEDEPDAGPSVQMGARPSAAPSGPASFSTVDENAPVIAGARAMAADFSPAKVQRAVKRKVKEEGSGEDGSSALPETDAAGATVTDPAPAGPTHAADQAAAPAAPVVVAPAPPQASPAVPTPDLSTPLSPHVPAPAAPASSGAPAEFRPTKVRRVQKKQKKASPPAPEAAEAPASPPSFDLGEGAPSAQPRAVTPRAGVAEAFPAAQEEASPHAADQHPPAAPPKDATAPVAVLRAPGAGPEAAASASAPASSASPEAPKPRKRPAPIQVSKEEQAVRYFHALHTILRNPLWRKAATSVSAPAIGVFAPRVHFDKQWTNPDFRQGLKAASRLASTFAFDPQKSVFDERVIETIRAFPLDPDHQIKGHTELLSKALGEKTVEAILKALGRNDVKLLLYSVGTRLGTFVPTVEILARIYIGLRKKEDVTPGMRLTLQEEVLLKYRRAPYSPEMARRARNLSVNYFMDYLVEFGLKLYKERLNRTPDGQNNLSAQKRRHETIKANCARALRDWGVRVGCSQPTLTNMSLWFSEVADGYLETLAGQTTEPEGDPPPSA